MPGEGGMEGGAPAAIEGAAGATGKAVKTASESLGGALENLGEAQGAAAALGSLAETGAGEIPGQDIDKWIGDPLKETGAGEIPGQDIDKWVVEQPSTAQEAVPAQIPSIGKAPAVATQAEAVPNSTQAGVGEISPGDVARALEKPAAGQPAKPEATPNKVIPGASEATTPAVLAPEQTIDDPVDRVAAQATERPAVTQPTETVQAAAEAPNPAVETAAEDVASPGTIEAEQNSGETEEATEITPEDIAKADAEGAENDAAAAQEAEAVTETAVEARSIEQQTEEMVTLTEQLKGLREQQTEIANKIDEAMAKIDSLRDAIRQAMEKAPPEQKQQFSLLLRLIQAFFDMFYIDARVEGGGIRQARNREIQEKRANTQQKPADTKTPPPPPPPAPAPASAPLIF